MIGQASTGALCPETAKPLHYRMDHQPAARSRFHHKNSDIHKRDILAVQKLNVDTGSIRYQSNRYVHRRAQVCV